MLKHFIIVFPLALPWEAYKSSDGRNLSVPLCLAQYLVNRYWPTHCFVCFYHLKLDDAVFLIYNPWLTIPLHHRDFQMTLPIQDVVADPRIKDGYIWDQSCLNLYIRVKDVREDKSKCHYELCGEWIALSPVCSWWQWQAAGALGNSPHKGTCLGEAAWVDSGCPNYYWCHQLSCQNRIMWLAQGVWVSQYS